MKTLAVGFLGLFIGLIAGLSLFFIGISTTPKQPNPPVTSPAAAARPELSVIVSAPFAAAQIQQVIRTSGIAKNATVTFAPPNLIRVATNVEVNVLGLPLSINATVSMRLTVQKGLVVLTTDSVDAGGFSMPSSVIDSTVEPVRAQAEEQINRLVQRQLQGTNLHLSNIRITADALTVELSAQ